MSDECMIGSRGSFVIAAICRDGVVMVSESRANIFDKTDQNQTPIAYYDTCQKIFPLADFAMAETGQGLILGVFFSIIVEEFSQAVVTPPPAPELLPTFIQFCKDHFSDAAFVEIRKQKLFAAGYADGQPVICYFDECQNPGPFGFIQGSGFIQSAPTSFSDHAASLSSMSADEVIEAAGKAIQAFASVGDRWMTIGGPLDAMQITVDGCRWIRKGTPDQKWRNIQDFMQEYYDGDIALSLIPPATREDLENLLSTVSKINGRAT